MACAVILEYLRFFIFLIFIFQVYHIYREIFPPEKYPLPPSQLPIHITTEKLFIGDVTLNRRNCSAYEKCDLLLLRDQKTVLKNLMQCVKMNWISILVRIYISSYPFPPFYSFVVINSY